MNKVQCRTCHWLRQLPLGPASVRAEYTCVAPEYRDTWFGREQIHAEEQKPDERNAGMDCKAYEERVGRQCATCQYYRPPVMGLFGWRTLKPASCKVGEGNSNNLCLAHHDPRPPAQRVLVAPSIG